MSAYSSHHFSYTEQKNRRLKVLRAFVVVVLVVVAYEILTGLFFRPVSVGGSAMEPGLQQSNRVIVCPIVYRFGGNPKKTAYTSGIFSPKRGDVVLVAPPYYESLPFPASVLDTCIRIVTFQRLGYRSGERASQYGTLTIKRVIGVPGDVVKIENGVASVNPGGVSHFLSEFEFSKKSYDLIQGKTLENWSGELPFSSDSAEFSLGPDQYFVLNDNRTVSNDSRSWGPVSHSRIIGKVLWRYWPIKR